ncbi:MAG: TetR/AcrR family transcriptional regulator [Rhodothermaceae bacterium]|nr:TetR/AcrR family transcriptional regulator [Rhodothermaceae bacterium]
MHAPQTRRERERLSRRNAILEAAQKEFADKGYAQAKLEDIAKRAEFGKGTLYNYFKGGKQGMLFASFDQLFDDSEALIHESFSNDIMGHKSFREVFYDYTLSCLTFYIDRKELFLILVKEAHLMCFGDDQKHAQYFRDRRDRLIDALSVPVRRAMDAGFLRTMDPLAVAHMILGNIEGIQIHAFLEGELQQKESESFAPEKAAHFLTTFLLDGLANKNHNHPNEVHLSDNAPHDSSHVQSYSDGI